MEVALRRLLHEVCGWRVLIGEEAGGEFGGEFRGPDASLAWEVVRCLGRVGEAPAQGLALPADIPGEGEGGGGSGTGGSGEEEAPATAAYGYWCRLCRDRPHALRRLFQDVVDTQAVRAACKASPLACSPSAPPSVAKGLLSYLVTVLCSATDRLLPRLQALLPLCMSHPHALTLLLQAFAIAHSLQYSPTDQTHSQTTRAKRTQHSAEPAWCGGGRPPLDVHAAWWQVADQLLGAADSVQDGVACLTRACGQVQWSRSSDSDCSSQSKSKSSQGGFEEVLRVLHEHHNAATITRY